jgi:hypothetical protein
LRVVVVLLLLTAVFTQRATAAWEEGGSTNTTVYYIDRSTITHTGNFGRMWNVTNYNEPQTWQGHSFNSSKALW